MSQKDLQHVHVMNVGQSDDERGGDGDTDSLEYAKSPLHIRFDALDQRWSAKKLAGSRSSPETIKSTDSFHSDSPSVRRTNTTTSQQTPPTPQQSEKSIKSVQIIGSPDFIPILLDEGAPSVSSRAPRSSSRRSVGSESGSVFDRLYNHGKKKVATARQREIDARMSPSNSGASPSDTSRRFSPSYSLGGSTISTLSSTGSVHERLHRNEKRPFQRRKSQSLTVPSSSRSVSSLDRRKAYSNAVRADHSSRWRSSTSVKRPTSTRSSRSVASINTLPPALMLPKDISRTEAIDEMSVSTAPTRSDSVFDRLFRGEKRSTESLLPESYRTQKSQSSTPKTRSRRKLPATRRQDSDATPLRKGGRMKREIAENDNGDQLSGIFYASFELQDDRNASFATARMQDCPAMDDSFYGTVSDCELSSRKIGDEASSNTDESLLVDHSFFNEDEDDSFTSARTTQRSESSLLQDQQAEMQKNINAARMIQHAVRAFLSGAPKHRRETAAAKLQNAWRKYRSELALVDRMLVGWWMKCDYESSSDYNSIIVLKMGIESLKKAIREVYGSAHASSVDIQSDRIVVEWTKEVVVHIDVMGSLVMECAVLRLKCSTRRPSIVKHWSSSKTAHLIIRTTLERVLSRDENKFLHASATIIQRWTRKKCARKRLESHGLLHLVEVTNLVLQDKFLSPTSAHGKAVICIQSAMRCHRAQLQACTRLLKSWWLKCDFQSSMPCSRILLMKIQLLGVTKAIGQVDCCWVTDNMEMHETSIHLAWQREVGIHFEHKGVPRLESCIVKLSCQAGRSAITAGWEQRKLAILFIKAALIRVAKRDQAALVVASARAIQSWWRMVPARRFYLDTIRVQRAKDCEMAARIQHAWRRHYEFVTAQSLNQQKRLAILLIQKTWRSTLKAKVEQKSSACLRIQALHRGVRIRRQYSEATIRARIIQRTWRRHAAVSSSQVARSANVIQTYMRMQLSQRNFTRKRQGAIAIQKWLRFLTNQKAETQRAAAAIVLQRNVRCHQAQSNFACLVDIAVRIQTAVRLTRDQRQYKKTRQAISMIQTTWRSEQKRRTSTLLMACIRIQSILRGCIARKAQRESSHSALVIQRTWRRHDAFAAYQTLKSAGVLVLQKYARSWLFHRNYITHRRAAIVVQGWYRRRLDQHAIHAREAAASIILQRFARSRRAQRQYTLLSAGIVSIQAAVRSLKIRQQYQSKRAAIRLVQEAWRSALTSKRADWIHAFAVAESREAAAIIIQRRWRVCSSFSAYQAMLARVLAIQKWVRVWSTQRKLIKERQKAILIQKWYRQTLREQSIENRAMAAAVIQQAARGHQARVNCARSLLGILKIQKRVRGSQGRGQYQQKQRAALRIQGVWRTLHGKRTRQVRAFVKIQSFFRRRSASSSLKKAVRNAALIQKTWRRYVAISNYEAALIRKDALLIQSYVRAWLSRRNFILQKSQAILLQRWYRRSLIKEQARLKQELAAVVMQRYVRGCQARANIVCVQEAVVCLQNAVRASKARHQYEQKRVAVLFIQDTWRSEMTRRRTVQLQALIKEEYLEAARCAHLIQRTWRRHSVLSAYRTLSIAGALVIQSNARTFLAQRKFILQRDEAIIIQRWYRRSINHQASKQRRNAAIVIQRNVRSHKIRSQHVHFLAAVTLVQAAVRAFHSQREYGEKRTAGLLIQESWRSALLTKRSRRLRACARIQSRVRGNSVRETQRKASSSALVIQKTWRRYDAFSAYQTLKYSGVLIVQKCTRAWLCKLSFIRKRNAAVRIQKWYQRASREQTNRQIETAAIVLQRNIRRHQARIKYLDKVAHTNRNSAILLIQSIVRAALQRQKYGSLRFATIAIQSLARRKVQRKNYLDCQAGVASLRALERRAQAATVTIQSFIRKALVQSRARSELDAVIKIQRQARARSLTRTTYAVVLLQAWSRGSAVRWHRQREQENATTIQAAFRCHQCRKSFTRVIGKVKLLQSMARGRSQRKISTKLLEVAKLRREKRDVHTLALTRFQATARAKLASRLYKQQKHAARVLQRTYFRWKMNLTLLNVQSSIVLLKRSMRGQLERSATRFALSHVNASLQIFDHISKEAGYGLDSDMISRFSDAKRMAQNSAVVVLQSAARRFLAVVRKKRMLLHSFESTRWRMEPATLIKSVFSRLSQRNGHEQHHRAATIVQTNYRRHLQLKKYCRLRELAIALQGRSRMRLSMAKLQDVKARAAASASTKEAEIKHSINIRQTTNATLIQRAFRGFSQRKEQEQSRRAAIVLQLFWRRAVGSIRFRRLCSAVVKIQRWSKAMKTDEVIRLKHAEAMEVCKHDLEKAILQEMERKAMDQVGLMLLKSPRKVRRTSACVRRLARRVKSVSRKTESKENSAPNLKSTELSTVQEHDSTLPPQSQQRVLPFQESRLS